MIDMTAMKAQTFGVEIEMANIRRDKAAKLVAQYFGTTSYYIGQGCYDIYGCKDTQGRVWQFERDASIYASEPEKCEMVTPILHYDDIETLQEIIRILRKNGAKSNPSYNCGVHIHVGAAGQTPKTIRNLVNTMAKYEDLMLAAVNVAPERLHWCKTVDPKFLKELNKRKPETMEELADVWYKGNDADYNRNAHYNDSRYHMVNLHATFTKGTIEFRLFQFDNPEHVYKGGLHAGKMKAYIQLVLAICERAKEIRSTTPEKVQMDNPKFAMRMWLVNLGLKGEEFETCRKWMTDRLEGDTNHRNVA